MIQSFIFRILLAIVSILLIGDTNICNIVVYSIIILVYLLVFGILRSKEKEIPRLIWDFVFINLVVFQSDFSTPLVYFFVLMPLINATNYTGKNDYFYLLILFTVTTIGFNTFIVEKTEYQYTLIVPIFILTIMYFVSSYRYNRWKFDNELTSKIDEFFLSPKKLKAHQIYDGLIEQLNRYARFSKGSQIVQIKAYRLKSDVIWLVNASTFIWERCEKLDHFFLSELKKKKCLWKKKINLELIYYYIQKEDIEYVFICIIKNNSLSSPLSAVSRRHFNSALNLTFNKLSLLLNTEYRLHQRRDEKFREIKDYVIYVNKATRMMHFIRNRMTPISNLIAFHKSEKSMTAEIKLRMQREMSKLYRRADYDLREILSYADYLLDDSNNPYAETEIREVDIHQLFIILSDLVEQYLEIAVELDAELMKEMDNEKVVHTNLIQYKILILDWIENMRKYSGDNRYVSMSMVNENLIIHFENTFIGEPEELQALIKNLNSRSKDAVLEGKNFGHGIYIIKSIANAFDIGIKAERKITECGSNLFCIDFKLYTYERKENLDI